MLSLLQMHCCQDILQEQHKADPEIPLVFLNDCLYKYTFIHLHSLRNMPPLLITPFPSEPPANQQAAAPPSLHPSPPRDRPANHRAAAPRPVPLLPPAPPPGSSTQPVGVGMQGAIKTRVEENQQRSKVAELEAQGNTQKAAALRRRLAAPPDTELQNDVTALASELERCYQHLKRMPTRAELRADHRHVLRTPSTVCMHHCFSHTSVVYMI